MFFGERQNITHCKGLCGPKLRVRKQITHIQKQMALFQVRNYHRSLYKKNPVVEINTDIHRANLYTDPVLWALPLRLSPGTDCARGHCPCNYILKIGYHGLPAGTARGKACSARPYKPPRGCPTNQNLGGDAGSAQALPLSCTKFPSRRCFSFSQFTRASWPSSESTLHVSRLFQLGSPGALCGSPSKLVFLWHKGRNGKKRPFFHDSVPLRWKEGCRHHQACWPPLG